MAKLVMGYWDCPVCGSKGIAGTVLNCPSCGRARGDVKFYMKDVAEGEIVEENETSDIEYLSEEQEAQVGKSPDWYCSYCNSLNKDFAERCAVCGASREDSESNYFDQLKKREEAEAREKAQVLRVIPFSFRNALCVTHFASEWVVLATASRTTRISLKENELLTARVESAVAWTTAAPTGFLPRIGLWDVLAPRQRARNLMLHFYGPGVVWLEGSDAS